MIMRSTSSVGPHFRLSFSPFHHPGSVPETIGMRASFEVISPRSRIPPGVSIVLRLAKHALTRILAITISYVSALFHVATDPLNISLRIICKAPEMFT